MMNNQEILDNFGKIVISTVFDDRIKYFSDLMEDKTKWGTGKRYTEVFKKMSQEDQTILFEYIVESSRTELFAFLSIFEEHPEFKLIYEKDGKQIDLAKIIEMLKAEPIIKNGWIDRFSKFSKKNFKENQN